MGYKKFKRGKYGNWKKENKYTVIVKIDNDKFLKYRCRNLVKLCQFLDDKWSGWRWFNVYDRGVKIASYSKNHRPMSHSSDGHFFN